MQEYAALYLQRQSMERAGKDAERARMVREALAARPGLLERAKEAFDGFRTGIRPTGGVARPAH